MVSKVGRISNEDACGFLMERIKPTWYGRTTRLTLEPEADADRLWVARRGYRARAEKEFTATQTGQSSPSAFSLWRMPLLHLHVGFHSKQRPYFDGQRMTWARMATPLGRLSEDHC
jgi:hypothetical protein